MKKLDKPGFVYEITFPNDSRYIGMTTQTINARLSRHRAYCKKRNSPMAAHINEFGIDALMATIHLVSDDSEIRALLEIELIARRKMDGFKVLNLADGGFSPVGAPISEETLDKMSKSKIGMYAGEKNARTLLTDQQVKEVIQMLHEGVPRKVIKSKYPISTSGLCNICSGKTWVHIDRPEGFDRKGKDFRLSDEQIRQIRIRYRNGEKRLSLAKEFQVSIHMISSIVRKLTYKFVLD